MMPPPCLAIGMKYRCIADVPNDKSFEPAGKKVPDYWDSSKKLLADPSKFLESLLTFDKDNIPQATIAKVEPYIGMEEFTPEAVSKVSKACTSICMWARAMFMYHNVSLSVSAAYGLIRLFCR
jgi:dynein heavy chain